MLNSVVAMRNDANPEPPPEGRVPRKRERDDARRYAPLFDAITVR